MIITVDTQTFYSKNADLSFDILPQAHVKSFKMDNKWDKQKVNYHVGIRKIANQVKGVAVGSQDVAITIEAPQATWGQMMLNFKLAHKEDIAESSIPILGLLVMDGDDPDPAKRFLARQVIEFEFVISDVTGTGIESGKTDEHMISLTCIGTKNPIILRGGIPVQGLI